MSGRELDPGLQGHVEPVGEEFISPVSVYDPPLRKVSAGETYVEHRGPKPITREQIAKIGIREVNSARGESSFGMPEFFGIKDKKLMYQLVGQAMIEEMSEYHDPGRIHAVENTLKERLGLQNATVVIGSSGSDGLLMDTVYKIIPENTPVMGHGPQFSQVAYYAMSRGSEDLYLAVQPRLYTPDYFISPESFTVNAGMDKLIQEIESEKDTGEKKLIYINNPGTPLGDVGDIEKIRRLADLAQNYNHILLVDEAFGDVLEPKESAVQLTEEFDSVIVTRTLSKFYGMPEAGIGYAIMSKKIGDVYKNLLPPYSFRGPQLFIAEQMFTTNMMPEFRRKVLPQMRARKTQLMSMLDHFKVPYLPTDPRVPILTVVGPDERFHARLRDTYRFPTAKGSGFAVTHDYFTDQLVRVTVQNSKHRVSHQAHVLSLASNHV